MLQHHSSEHPGTSEQKRKLGTPGVEPGSRGGMRTANLKPLDNVPGHYTSLFFTVLGWSHLRSRANMRIEADIAVRSSQSSVERSRDTTSNLKLVFPKPPLLSYNIYAVHRDTRAVYINRYITCDCATRFSFAGESPLTMPGAPSRSDMRLKTPVEISWCRSVQYAKSANSPCPGSRSAIEEEVRMQTGSRADSPRFETRHRILTFCGSIGCT